MKHLNHKPWTKLHTFLILTADISAYQQCIINYQTKARIKLSSVNCHRVSPKAPIFDISLGPQKVM